MNLLSSSFGSGMGCLAFGLIVLCLILACRPCNFDEGITLSVSCPEVFSFDNAIPIVNNVQITMNNKKKHTYAQFFSSSHIEMCNRFLALQIKTIRHHTRSHYDPNVNPPQTLYSRNCCCLLFRKSSLQRNYQVERLPCCTCVEFHHDNG